MGGAFASLGWILGFVLSILFAGMCVYLAILQWQCQLAYPNAYSQRTLTREVFQNRGATAFVGITLYLLLFVVCASYLLALQQSLSGIFGDIVHLCQYQWTLVSCAILVPTLFLRNLSALKYLVKLACFLLVAVVIMVVAFVGVQLANHNDVAGTGTDSISPTMSMTSFFGGLSNICFAFCGLPVFLEMSAEMADRNDFPKSFRISVPIELVLFFLVSVSSYLYQGKDASSLLDTIPKGKAMYVAVNVFLFLYMIVAYTIKGIIISRALHIEIWPTTVDESGLRPTLQHVFCGTILLVSAFITATAIPVFNLVIQFCGALFIPLLAYQFPIVMAFKTRRNLGQTTKLYELVLWTFIMAFFLMLEIIGTWMNIKSLSTYFSNNKPFQC
mmetsp:Transcript_11205/g.24090  ORF Transcript_11205/g.24090 Transcript_11205/m.24090 type:complete len:387 (+) Transcript_11205:30-1190(+)